jgi:hypothetical protein
MDDQAFNAIVSSLDRMGKRQLNDLLNEVLEKAGIFIISAAYRENFDDTLEENKQEPLTFDEWNKFKENVSDAVDDPLDVIYDIMNDTIIEIRPTMFDEPESDDESEDDRDDDQSEEVWENMVFELKVKTDEDKKEFEDKYNEWYEHARCIADIEWSKNDDGGDFKWNGMCKFSTCDQDHPLVYDELKEEIEELGEELIVMVD